MNMGIACFPESVSRADDMLDRVDEALYNSKCSGRNRVSYYASEVETAASIA